MDLRLTRMLIALAAALALALAAWTVSTVVSGPQPATAGAVAKPKITKRGVTGIHIGDKYARLRNQGKVRHIRPGCNLAGPQARAAQIVPLPRGFVNFTQTKPRQVTNVQIRGGAKARGIGIGAKIPKIKSKFPNAKVRHATDEVFGITLVKIPKSDGGRFQFGVSTDTKKTTIIGVPYIAFCE